jgi:hypothetical protein
MEALGRLFNVVPVADGVEVNMRDASAVTFVCVGANAETFTLAEATDAAGTGAQTLATITRYYSGATSAGADAWVEETIAAGGVVTTTTAKPVAVIHVQQAEMSDGFDYLRVTSSSTGTVVAIVHDLNVQRDPANLPALAD